MNYNSFLSKIFTNYNFKTAPILFLFISITPAQKKEIVAYYPEFRSLGQTFYVKDLEKNGTASKLTVINYAFVEPGPDSTGNIIPKFISSYSAYREIIPPEISIDGIGDKSDQPLRGQFNQLRKLKHRHPHIKILLSIGGWGGSKYFSDLALTDSSRDKFVDACINWFIKGDLPPENNAGGENSAAGLFDGFDLDWEFPVKGGMEGNHYNPNDIQNHTALIALFRKKLHKINPGFLLTAAISARASEFWKYDFEKDQQYLDWYNVMTYDFHGSWESRTGHHTNLLSSPEDPDWEKESLDHTVQFLLDSAGVDKNKIVPGAAFYGKSWMNADSSNFGLYQRAEPDTVWNRLRFNDYINYPEASREGYICYWDNHSMAAWLYNAREKIFYTYDDIRSVALKARYVDAYALRGLMFWEITGDDSSGNLLNTIYNRNMPDIEILNKNSRNAPTAGTIKLITDSIIFTGSNLIVQPDPAHNRSIAKVEYFIDGSSIGYNRISPFSWVWFNASEGKHKLSAVITNQSGTTVTAVPVEIIVKTKLTE